jgi:hypothetical protein
VNASLASGYLLGSVVATVVWEVAIHLPTDSPGAALVTAGIVAPPVFAAASLAAIAVTQRSKPNEPSPRRVRQVRRAVAVATSRKELSR